MPRLLKKETIRLLDASSDCLSLANIGLAIPRKAGDFRCAAELGLIGCAAELAMSACLVEAYGNNFLQRDPRTGQFKTGAEIFSDFKKLLTDPTPRGAFLTDGIADGKTHRQALLSLTEKFGLLLLLRANALHAGKGSQVELAMSIATDVAAFLAGLAQSSKIKPYLTSIPVPVVPPSTRIALIEDLVSEIKTSSNHNHISTLLAAAFLVLPQIPDDEPAWLQALDRVQVAYNKNDVAFLVTLLSKAAPVTLVRQAPSASGAYIPVKYEPNNPAAVPSSFEFLKTSFTKIPEQWAGDVGNANGRIEADHLDLPPIEFVFDLFVLGLENANLPNSDPIPYSQTWPFIAASMNVQGTAAPYWFLVRKTDNLDQLKARLKKCQELSRAIANRFPEFLEGVEALSKKQSLEANSKLRSEMVKASECASQKYFGLPELAARQRGSDRDPGLEFEKLIGEYVEGNNALGSLLLKLLKGDFNLPQASVLYWVTKLSEAMDSEHDKESLLKVLRTADLSSRHTYARKAMRLIDFLDFGPGIEN